MTYVHVTPGPRGTTFRIICVEHDLNQPAPTYVIARDTLRWHRAQAHQPPQDEQ